MILWYLKHVLRLTGVHQLVKYEQGKPFSCFAEKVANTRREWDKDSLKKQLGHFCKLNRNTFYGEMIEDLGRQKSTKFTRDKWVVDKIVRYPFFDDLE